MFNLLGGIFKYSLLVLTILVLSHIIEIKGVTISNHVLHLMNAFPSYNPQNQAKLIKEEFAKTVAQHQQDLNKLDTEVSADDQKALNQVIQKAQDPNAHSQNK